MPRFRGRAGEFDLAEGLPKRRTNALVLSRRDRLHPADSQPARQFLAQIPIDELAHGASRRCLFLWADDLPIGLDRGFAADLAEWHVQAFAAASATKMIGLPLGIED